MAAQPSRILISGASVAGPILAYWLRRFGFEPTVVERTDELRLGVGGHAVDLEFLGVEPGRTGQGIGARLLAARLAEVDARGDPAYLESSNTRNLSLYERHGFDVIGELRLGPDAPVEHRMWRPGRGQH